MLTDLLFDTPWWLPTASIGVGLFLLFIGLRRGEKRPTRIGFIATVIGVGIATVSYLVETDLEMAVNRTYQLVAAVNQKDWPGFGNLLDPQTSLYDISGRETLVDLAREASERVGVQNVRIIGTSTEVHGPIILVNVRVLCELKSFGALPTDWQLQWQDFGKGRMLYSIRALKNESIGEEQIRAAINRR